MKNGEAVDERVNRGILGLQYLPRQRLDVVAEVLELIHGYCAVAIDIEPGAGEGNHV